MPITTTPSGGLQGEFSTYTPIYATTLSSGTTSVTLSNIPTTFTDLILVVNGYTANANSGDNIGIRFNEDSGSNYSWTRVYAVGSAASSRSTSQTVIGQAALGGGSASISSIIYNIQNYSNTVSYKPVLYKSQDGTTQVTASVGMWRSTSPIRSINLNTYASGVNFAAGTTFTVYGIKAATPAPKATGGDIITTDGTYWYHAFLNTGIFAPIQSLSCDYIVVAGGGGGGYAGSTTHGYGGGGGAGGYRSATSQSLAMSAYTVIVGAGGSTNTNGSDSSIAGSGITTVTSTGGGFGGNRIAAGRSVLYDGANGGSGGGAGNESKQGGLGNTPSTSPSQGNNGGAGYVGPNNAAGSGGGGAGAAGSAGTNNGAGGAGGAGTNTHSSWLSATGTGSSGYLAGGGGGGVENDSYAGGAGGSGGGGKGDGSNGDAVAGSANTGSGGGGGGTNTAKAGGSGVVIVRYAV